MYKVCLENLILSLNSVTVRYSSMDKTYFYPLPRFWKKNLRIRIIAKSHKQNLMIPTTPSSPEPENGIKLFPMPCVTVPTPLATIAAINEIATSNTGIAQRIMIVRQTQEGTDLKASLIQAPKPVVIWIWLFCII